MLFITRDYFKSVPVAAAMLQNFVRNDYLMSILTIFLEQRFYLIQNKISSKLETSFRFDNGINSRLKIEKIFGCYLIAINITF